MAASCRTANRYKDLTRYQSFVLGVCSIGWMLDTTAQQIS
jgi:IS4 transposase